MGVNTARTLYVGTGRYKSHSERLEIRFICSCWSISLILDPDPPSQYGSGIRRAKLMQIRIRNTD